MNTTPPPLLSMTSTEKGERPILAEKKLVWCRDEALNHKFHITIKLVYYGD